VATPAPGAKVVEPLKPLDSKVQVASVSAKDGTAETETKAASARNFFILSNGLTSGFFANVSDSMTRP